MKLQVRQPRLRRRAPSGRQERLAARTGRPTTIAAICMTGWGTAVIVAGLHEPAPTLIAAMLLLGPLPVGAMMSLPTRAVAPERRGAASGIFMAFLFAGTTVFPALAGWIGERFGGDDLAPAAAAVTFSGAAFLTALAPLLLLDRMASQRPGGGGGRSKAPPMPEMA